MSTNNIDKLNIIHLLMNLYPVFDMDYETCLKLK